MCSAWGAWTLGRDKSALAATQGSEPCQVPGFGLHSTLKHSSLQVGEADSTPTSQLFRLQYLASSCSFKTEPKCPCFPAVSLSSQLIRGQMRNSPAELFSELSSLLTPSRRQPSFPVLCAHQGLRGPFIFNYVCLRNRCVLR